MNYKMMGRFIAQTVFVETLFMLPALIIRLCCREMMAVRGFLWAIGAMLAAQGMLWLLSRGAPKTINAKEGLVCASASWIVMSLLGCLPFYISREIPGYIDALFEIVSGFTTTGASVVASVE